eukprot:5687703-Pleurochrysis_carterae.AAC.2
MSTAVHRGSSRVMTWLFGMATTGYMPYFGSATKPTMMDAARTAVLEHSLKAVPARLFNSSPSVSSLAAIEWHEQASWRCRTPAHLDRLSVPSMHWIDGPRAWRIRLLFQLRGWPRVPLREAERRGIAHAPIESGIADIDVVRARRISADKERCKGTNTLSMMKKLTQLISSVICVLFINFSQAKRLEKDAPPAKSRSVQWRGPVSFVLKSMHTKHLANSVRMAATQRR